jgi:hypothetical protein
MYIPESVEVAIKPYSENISKLLKNSSSSLNIFLLRFIRIFFSSFFKKYLIDSVRLSLNKTP